MKFSKNVNNKKYATKLNEKKMFLKLQFLKHLKLFLLKLWPKLSLGLDVRSKIPILKVIYYIANEVYKIR